MSHEELRKECDELIDCLSDFMVSPVEAQRLSARYLTMKHRISNVLLDVRNELVKFNVAESIKYGEAFAEQDPKLNVSKARAYALSNKKYLSAMKKKKECENEKKYWKEMLSLMEQGHFFYKSLCRD